MNLHRLRTGLTKPRQLCLSLLLLGLCAAKALAVGTERFVLDSEQDLSDGSIEGAAIESSGQVIAGQPTRRVPIDAAATGRALLTIDDWGTFIGAGTQGTLYTIRGDKAVRFAETDTLMVTALAEGPARTLYAGTTPRGQIFQIDRQGHVQELVALPDTEHIWALAFDAAHQQLFAATGPEGRIYRITTAGKAEVYLDTEATHVLSMVLTPDGRLFAGTTDEALLLEVLGPKRAQVIYDFEGNEVTALAVRGNTIWACENHFTAPGAKKKTGTPSPAKNAVSNDNPSGTAGAVGKTKAGKPKKGQLWELTTTGLARRLFESPAGHLTAVLQDGDDIFVANGTEGQIYRVSPSGTHALWVDVDERQVLALEGNGATLRFLTGDGSAFYQTLPAGRQPARWISKTLDAEFQARFGQLDFRSSGSVQLQTRSGNTSKPDDTWSAWSSAITQPGPIRSPAARFLQIRASLEQDARIFAMVAYYRPHNQPPVVHSVRAAPAQDKKAKDNGSGTTHYQIQWEADNVDNDKLRYRLSYRPESDNHLRPMLAPHQRWTKTKYDWNTDSVPDGYYLIHVEASDELANAAQLAKRHSATSEPVLVDNHPPHVTDLALQGGQLSGKVTDSLGPIRTLEYKLDRGPWLPLSPDDDLLDTAQESFHLKLPSSVHSGVHVLGVRARDARDNLGSAELEFTAP